MKLLRKPVEEGIDKYTTIKYTFINFCRGTIGKSFNNSLIDEATEYLQKYDISLVEELAQIHQFLKGLYGGDRIGGNLRFLAFVLKEDHLYRYINYKKSSKFVLVVKYLYDIYYKKKHIFLGAGGIENLDWTDKRERIYNEFCTYLDRNGIKKEDYFDWFFNEFLMSQKDVTPGFWFSLSVYGSHAILLHKQKKKTIRVIENNY